MTLKFEPHAVTVYAEPADGGVRDHEYLPVAGHLDDDECTYRSDGTSATYCGCPEDDHYPYITHITMTCTAGPGAPCRMPSHCGCDDWFCYHPCWVKSWFDADLEATIFDGPDQEDSRPKPVPRTGLIRVTGFDDAPIWEWA